MFSFKIFCRGPLEIRCIISQHLCSDVTWVLSLGDLLQCRAVFPGEGRKIPQIRMLWQTMVKLLLCMFWVFFSVLKAWSSQRNSGQKENKINEIIGMVAGFQMSLPMLLL